MDIILSLLMLAGIGLIVGAVFAFRRGDRRTALLMVAAGAIMLINVGIWTLPTDNGETLANAAASQR